MNDNLKDMINEKGTVMVEFFATWCPHCHRMMPVVDDLRALYDGRVAIHQLDFDKNGELANELGVSAVPTFIIYKDGEEVWRGSGEMPATDLNSQLEAAL